MPGDRRLRAWVAGLGVALGLGLAAPSLGQGAKPPADPVWTSARKFRVPLTLPAKTPKPIRELILYISDDRGNFWKKADRTTPDSREFAVRVPSDGEYWFAVQTVYTDGELFPRGDTPVDPTLRVMVDATKPTIRLEPTARRGSDAGVRWEVQDDNLLLSTLVLEYQYAGARDWRQVPLELSERKLIGVKTWDAGTASAFRARMSVRDRAGNVQTVEQIMPDGLAANPGPSMAEVRAATPPRASQVASRPAPDLTFDDDDGFAPVDAPPGGVRGSVAEPGDALPANGGDGDFAPQPDPTPAPPRSVPGSNPAPAGGNANGAGPTLMVASPRFPLRYAVEDAGPGGPALVELWTTRDGGRTWSRQPEDADRTSPYNVDLGGEGTYGLWLVVQSASGLGDPPPAPNDRPQSWVEVDSAPPVVSIDRPRVGTGASAGKVLVTWRAGDSHLSPKPITISYRAEGADSPWVPIASEIDNSGRFVWEAPMDVPPRIHLKVEATDTLGNRGAASTEDFGPVVLDRARPRGANPRARHGERDGEAVSGD